MIHPARSPMARASMSTTIAAVLLSLLLPGIASSDVSAVGSDGSAVDRSATASGAASSSVQEARPDPTDDLDEIFGSWDTTRSPGCAVAVDRPGEPVLARAWGMADLEHGVPNAPTTVFEAGSVSKQFTAAAVVLLVLDDRIDLEDDIRDYIPEIPDYGTPIRIHHLLNHTSGLRDWGSVAAISGWGRGDRTHTHDHVLDIASRQSALNYPPGEAYSYTNTGYNLLVILVERVTGEPFADFSRTRIFEPLGLSSTGWRDDYRRIVPGRSAAYSPADGGFRINRPIEDVHGNGGLLTTVDDLLTWDRALRDGSFHGPEFGELMHRQGVLNDGRTIEYASALFVGERRGVPHISHTGATSGYRAYLGHYPDQELTVGLLCNVSNANPGGLGGQIADLFLGDLSELEDPSAPEGIELAPDDLELRAGLYRDEATGEPVSLDFADGRLRLGNTPLMPLSTTEFHVGDGARRLHFDGPASDRRTAFAVTDDGGSAGRFVPTAPADPGPDELREYAGSYHSDDAETTLELVVEAGELHLHRRPSTRMTLDPIYPDAFRSGLGLIRFHRDPDGGITELSLRQGRVHDLRFDRAGGP